MIIQQLLQKYSDIEIDLLLSHVLGKPKEFLYLHPKHTLTALQYNHVLECVARRQKGEPIAYIVGYKYFYGLKFKVNKNVLIPRPETEWLVDRALARVKSYKVYKVKSKRTASILDIGTGSGCIAISIATRVLLVTNKEHPCKVTILASDISDKALAVAQSNAKTHKANITFIQSNLFENISGKFNIITANLPYVPQGMYELLYDNLQYEPKTAITDGSEEWEIYYRFFSQLPRHLKPSGTALLEIDDGSKPQLQAMLKKLLPGWKAMFHKDLGGLWRFIIIKRPAQ